MTDNTVTADEWLILRLVLGNAPEADPAEVIDTLRTLREHVGDAALAHGFDLDEPVGPALADQVVREAAPALQRTLIKAVPA
jgi:hypothetical protein